MMGAFQEGGELLAAQIAADTEHEAWLERIAAEWQGRQTVLSTPAHHDGTL